MAEQDDIPPVSNDIPIDPQIDSLIQKIGLSRGELEKDLEDIRKLKEKLELLLPTEINFRNKFILEEKIKTITSFYSTMLNIRQEINKTLTSEIDIRRKISDPNGDQNSGINIRDLANQIEEARNQRVVFSREPEKGATDTKTDDTEQIKKGDSNG